MQAADSWERLLGGERLVAVAGAGGKKSTMYALASRCPGRAGLTTTVNCPFPPRELQAHLVVEEEEGLLQTIRATSRGYRRVFFARPGKHADWAAGIRPELVAQVHAAQMFDLLLVKADGARHRLIKAPADGEPIYPPGTELVLYLVSAHVLGRQLNSGIAHRMEEFIALTGAAEGTVIRPEHIVSLLTSAAGALKGIAQGMRVVPVINRVDTPERRRQARAIAERALSASPRLSGVVLGCMGEFIPQMEYIESS
ncbi:MAG TPA: selenium cofactor biosynthesis protein YqeC [Rhodanobacter sp.]|jgi:probable selenium-dependent hydroxylase accessory protein YqeC|nr:selenium cofactor biosynthesis protein YqeC [Rhodanobacter sp.]